MITIRPAGERGATRTEWLDSRHTFSFNRYYDPRHMGFRSLRVVNDDRVEPGRGFGRHSHRDMEILSYVLEGGLAHEDSSGGGGVIRPGDVQRMSAGTGITHAEYNASDDERVHFLQIWILPVRAGLAPGYEQKTFAAAERQDRLRLVASRDAREGSLTIHQDVSVYAALLGPGREVEHALAPGRHAWVHVARGALELDGQALGEGDGAALSGEPRVLLRGRDATELLLFDLA
jgi:hypothetical protein